MKTLTGECVKVSEQLSILRVPIQAVWIFSEALGLLSFGVLLRRGSCWVAAIVLMFLTLWL